MSLAACGGQGLVQSSWDPPPVLQSGGDAGAGPAQNGDDAGVVTPPPAPPPSTADAGAPAPPPPPATTDAGTPAPPPVSADAGWVDAGSPPPPPPPAPDGGVRAGPYRVLFDAAHKQVAGNADWIVDDNAPAPQPADPTSETSWNGGISAWGYDLYASGRYTIAQLPGGASLSWGGGGPGDLQQFDVFVSDEPELDFSSSEQAALVSFAQAGGGIFMVTDHSGAVRCSGCTEAWRVVNGFLTGGAGGQFGVQADGNDIGTGGLTGTATSAPLAPRFTSGPFGGGTSLYYSSGSSVSLTGSNAAAQVVVSSTSGGMIAASSLPAGGRLVLMGDSSPPDDGTCSCSAKLYGGWGQADDKNLILNATAWLAHDGS